MSCIIQNLHLYLHLIKCISCSIWFQYILCVFTTFLSTLNINNTQRNLNSIQHSCVSAKYVPKYFLLLSELFFFSDLFQSLLCGTHLLLSNSLYHNFLGLFCLFDIFETKNLSAINACPIWYLFRNALSFKTLPSYDLFRRSLLYSNTR